MSAAAETGAASGHRSLRSGIRISRRASPHARRPPNWVDRDMASDLGIADCRQSACGVCWCCIRRRNTCDQAAGRKVREFWRRSLLLTAGQRRAREHRAAMLWGIQDGSAHDQVAISRLSSTASVSTRKPNIHAGAFWICNSDPGRFSDLKRQIVPDCPVGEDRRQFAQITSDTLRRRFCVSRRKRLGVVEDVKENHRGLPHQAAFAGAFGLRKSGA